MLIAKVIGNIVSTQKDPALKGYKLLAFMALKKEDVFDEQVEVAVDTIGAGIGELVLIVSGSAAQRSLPQDRIPVDNAIVGIIDSVDIEWPD